MPEGPLRYLLYGDTVAVNLALALVLGGLASEGWSSRTSSGWGQDMARKACRVRRLGFSLGVVALLAMGWLQAASMRDATDVAVGTAAWTLLKDTHFGRVWMAGLVGWCLATAAAWSVDADGAQTRHRLLAAAGLSAFVWSRSVVSHAGSQGDWSQYVAIDWLHLVLVSLWVGIVLVAAAAKLPAVLSHSVDRLAAAQWVAYLSSTATVALVGIVLTGAFKAWHSLPSIGALWTSDYGLLLLVKVGLVVPAAALGGYNRFVVLPLLFHELASAESSAAGRWRRHLVLAFRFEASFLVLVLIAAAALSSTEPPGLG
jgi:putative copper resistance protein D